MKLSVDDRALGQASLLSDLNLGLSRCFASCRVKVIPYDSLTYNHGGISPCLSLLHHMPHRQLLVPLKQALFALHRLLFTAAGCARPTTALGQSLWLVGGCDDPSSARMLIYRLLGQRVGRALDHSRRIRIT